MVDNGDHFLDDVPEYKRFAAERSPDPLQEMTSNGEIEFSSLDTEVDIPPATMVGEDQSELAHVPNFALHTPWSEEIPEELLGLPHVSTTLPVPETVCGRDDRALIGNTAIAPWKFIAKLYIDNRWVASGFFIAPRCVVTNGHVVFPNNAWANRITVVPGQNGGTAPFGSACEYSVL